MAASRIRIGQIELNVLDEGSGAPVLLLHGFPDSSRLWRHQTPALVEAGYRVIAPDLRGFGESDKPTQVQDYAISVVVQDMVGLLDQFGIQRTHVVCHDWGAVAGWVLAALAPQRVDHLVAMSVGHPNAMRAAGLDQSEKSWYMLLFQFVDVAEELLSREDWAFFRDWVRHHPEADTWVKDLSRPGGLTAGLNWYRANTAPHLRLNPPPPLPVVEAPVLALWSSGDAYLTEAPVANSAQWVRGPWSYRRVEGASHWMQLDRPALINRLILDFLRADAKPS